LNKDDFKKLTNNEKLEYNKNKSKNISTNKQLKKELVHVKIDIIEGTLNSDQKYHQWITNTKLIIFPELKNEFKTHMDQLNVCPQMYLKYMLIMNQKLEQNNKKLFQPICLRTEITDKYIHIDTWALRDIFTQVNSDKTVSQLWKEYFNINPKKLYIQ